eukprot:9235585-Alexandrium_andersonii.AAC.1
MGRGPKPRRMRPRCRTRQRPEQSSPGPAERLGDSLFWKVASSVNIADIISNSAKLGSGANVKADEARP